MHTVATSVVSILGGNQARCAAVRLEGIADAPRAGGGGRWGLRLVEMAVSRLFLPREILPGWMLMSAFGAAALFAVAAAVTLFAVEREVGTTVLLELLPQNRAALFAGKVLAAVAMTLGVLGVSGGCDLWDGPLA